MVPFLSSVLVEIFKSLMKMIVKREIITSANTAYKISKIDVAVADNQIPVDSIDLGTALKEMLASLPSRPEKKREFKAECCQKIIIKMIQKLQERSPLQYTIVRSAASLDPGAMVECKEQSIVRFKMLVEKMAKMKWISAETADDAKQQYD